MNALTKSTAGMKALFLGLLALIASLSSAHAEGVADLYAEASTQLGLIATGIIALFVIAIGIRVIPMVYKHVARAMAKS